MANVIALLIAIFKAAPILKSWFDELVAAYTASQISTMEKENVDDIREAVTQHDQRNLEKALGNPNAGMPSGDAGAIIVDHPPPNIH